MKNTHLEVLNDGSRRNKFWHQMLKTTIVAIILYVIIFM
jgi:hypothetical protein